MPHTPQNAPQPAQDGQARVEVHQVVFHTNRFEPGLSRARCTCGWFHLGPLDECQSRAAQHDLGEWEAVEPTDQPAAVAS